MINVIGIAYNSRYLFQFIKQGKYVGLVCIAHISMQQVKYG